MRGDTLMTPDKIAVHVRSSWKGRAGIGWFSWEHHEKVPDRCSLSRLATLHGAP